MNPGYLQTVFHATSGPADWPQCFAIVTAYNPHGDSYSAEENEKFDKELEFYLKQKNIWHWRMSGNSPNFEHVEPGFAAKLSLEDALECGKRFRQEAIYWINDDSLFLVSCSENHSRLLLGSWLSRLIS